jgi:signal recognition particle receptor subunit beta
MEENKDETTKTMEESKAEEGPQTPSETTLWQTAMRESITPFLPPPIVRSIQRFDPVLEPYVGSEATVTVTGTLLATWLVLWISTRIFRRSGRAITEDDTDRVFSAGAGGDEFDATVVLTGPRNAGKTRLFYQLCYAENNLPTLMSLKANVGIASCTSATTDANQTTIRYMDWPGHASVSDPALVSVLKSKKDVRIVFVLDATQPVSQAADTLYQWLNLLHAKKKKTTIFVACHKKDFPKAKNDRRIKIQLRTELERLLTTKAAAGETAAWVSSQPLELDELSFVTLHFCATTCEGRGNAELVKFCRTGVVSTAIS